MGWRLAGEVIEHYRGPDHKWRWLVVFAWSAKDRTRTGWPSRDVMRDRTGKSGSRVSNIATELVTDGVLKRVGGGGKHRGNARYTLLPLTTDPVDNSAQGSPATNPDAGSQGSPGRTSGFASYEPQGSRPNQSPAQTPYGKSGKSGKSSPRARDMLRAVDPSVTEEEATEVVRILSARPAVRDPIAVLGAEIRNGNGYALITEARHRLGRGEPVTPPLPASRAAAARTAACRSDDHEYCPGPALCSCGCHTGATS
jgi:hypothetical protein